jgi:hypothetical protein
MNDRTNKFLARVDAHLKTLAGDGKRRSFLAQQIAAWEFRYKRFRLTDGASEPLTDPANPPHAADFVLTIMALHSRQDVLVRVCACPYHKTLLPRCRRRGRTPRKWRPRND